MNRQRKISSLVLAVGLVMGGLVFSLAAYALVRTADETPLKLTSYAIDLGVSNLPTHRRLGVLHRRAGIVQIAIDHWSSAQERDGLLDTLRTQGADNLLSNLQKAPPVGTIRTPDRIGWDLHYAWETPTDDGGRRIFIATDRPIRFWEAANLTRTYHYPFTLIEIHLDKNGKGEGRMSVATKISLSKDGKTIELENYTTQPVLLEQVSIQK
jgi:hypothetical protein